MKQPTTLFRFRPFQYDHDFKSLEESYLWASSFTELNDPMEAFLRFDSQRDALLFNGRPDAIRHREALQKIISDILPTLSVVCFSTNYNLRMMWGYYANSFRGACLEYDTSELMQRSSIGVNKLDIVEYCEAPYADFAFSNFREPNEWHQNYSSRLYLKHNDWLHEQEWRLVGGQEGARYISDLALKNIHCGPLMSDENKNKICDLVKNRTTSVFEISFDGYNLKPVLLQQGKELTSCERVSAKPSWSYNDFGTEAAVSRFFRDNIVLFHDEIENLLSHPNSKELRTIRLADDRRDQVLCRIVYQYRNGSEIYRSHLFNANCQLVDMV